MSKYNVVYQKHANEELFGPDVVKMFQEKKFQELAKNNYWLVRFKVAINEEAPEDILTGLSKDEHPNVRAGIASNPKTPINVLWELAKDAEKESEPYLPQEEVRAHLLSNPALSLELLLFLYESKEVEEIRAGIAQLEITPPYILSELSEDSSSKVVYYVARNPSTPKLALLEMFKMVPRYQKWPESWRESAIKSGVMENPSLSFWQKLYLRLRHCWWER